MNIPVPPAHEQDLIVKFLAERVAGIDVAIERMRREINLIQENRICLTADIVTGKLDVREAALKLPVISSEADSITCISEPEEEPIELESEASDE
jgi:type I restriction enzyme S subunit